MSTLLADGGANLSLWQDYLQTQFDPAHLLSELGFTLVFDGVLVVFWRRVLKPRLIRRTIIEAHREIDASHGMAHPDGLPLTPEELVELRALVRARLSERAQPAPRREGTPPQQA